MLSYRSLISIKIPSNLAKRSSARSQTGVFPCQSGRVHRVQRDKRLFISASIYLNLRDYYEACASHAGKQLPPKSFQQVIKHEKTPACAWWFAGELQENTSKCRGGHLKEKRCKDRCLGLFLLESHFQYDFYLPLSFENNQMQTQLIFLLLIVYTKWHVFAIIYPRGKSLPLWNHPREAHVLQWPQPFPDPDSRPKQMMDHPPRPFDPDMTQMRMIKRTGSRQSLITRRSSICVLLLLIAFVGCWSLYSFAGFRADPLHARMACCMF